MDTAHARTAPAHEADPISFSFRPTVLPITEPSAEGAQLSWAGAHLFAWLLLAFVGLTISAAHGSQVPGSAGTRALQYFYGAGQLLAAGAAAAVATLAFRARVSRSMIWATVGAYAATFTLAWTVVKNDFAVLGNRLAHIAPPLLWRVVFTLAVALAVPAALVAGRVLARRSRVTGAVLGMALFVAARMGFPVLVVPGTRLILVIASAVLISASLRGAAAPSFAAFMLGRSAAARRLPWALCALWGACAVVIPPPAQVAFHLLQPPAAVLAPFVAELHTPSPLLGRSASEVRAALDAQGPAIPSSRSGLLPADGVVVLVTIDCIRADLVAGEGHAAALPNITALRRSGASFTQARSGGNMTSVAIASLFTGRFESQLVWSERSTEHTRYVVPAEDPSPRFPAVLGAAGVPSWAVSGVEWMDAGSGLLRGFSEERLLGPAHGVAKGEDLVDAAIERVERHGAGPLFLYVHLLDAHDPYDRAGTEGTELERYVRELSLVDREVGRLVAAVDRRFGDRAVVMLSADHGEAFDEHHTSRHGHNVYDEVVRVPLLIRGAKIAPRVIEDSVSTMDVGPTVLDLFGAATPASFMGQSLVPALAGKPVVRAHPVAIETPGHTAMIDGGWKVVRRKRYDSVELYDLASDPRELRNVFQEGDRAAEARLQAMDAYFANARTH